MYTRCNWGSWDQFQAKCGEAAASISNLGSKDQNFGNRPLSQPDIAVLFLPRGKSRLVADSGVTGACNLQYLHPRLIQRKR
jgi:hypothetical protein